MDSIFSDRSAFRSCCCYPIESWYKNIDPSLAFAIQSILIVIASWNIVVWQGNLSEVTRIEKGHGYISL